LGVLRFVRRDGPRIFLDTRDLIGVVERNVPVSADDLAARLAEVNGRVVLVYTNVAELVPQTETKRASRSHVRRIMRELERLPLSYMRISEVPRQEFRAAIDAFESNGGVREINPYVNQWWQTLWDTPAEHMLLLAPRKSAVLGSMTLSQVLDFLIENNPEALRFGSADQERLAASVEDDRRRLGTSRGSSKSFRAGVQAMFVRNGWKEPSGGIEAFTDFVRTNSRICPGWRISHDVYEEYRCNLKGPVVKNDIPDFSHIAILPYVTHATLDRAWRARCAQAKHRALKNGLWADPYDRVFSDLAAVLESLPAAL
jgi:hypothetical protein